MGGIVETCTATRRSVAESVRRRVFSIGADVRSFHPDANVFFRYPDAELAVVSSLGLLPEVWRLHDDRHSRKGFVVFGDDDSRYLP